MSFKNFFSKNRKNYWWRHFFGLGLGLELCGSRSRSQNWDRDRSWSRSWSRKNFTVSVLVLDESVSTTALINEETFIHLLHCQCPRSSRFFSDEVETLMVETETKTETWKKFESKTRDQDLKKFSRPRSRLGEFFETETRLRDPRF